MNATNWTSDKNIKKSQTGVRYFFIVPKCTKMLKNEFFGQLFKLKPKINILNWTTVTQIKNFTLINFLHTQAKAFLVYL